MRKHLTNLRVAMALAAILGSATGAAAMEVVQQPSWPNQCYNYDGGSSCPICGGSCLGGIYLCCNNGATATASAQAQ